MADGIGIYSKDKKTLYFYYKNAVNTTSIKIDDNITILDIWTFYNCNKLTSLDIGKNVSNIGWSWVWAQCANSNLTTVKIDENNPYYVAENHGIYSKDKKTLIAVYGSVTEFKIPNGVETIGDVAFKAQARLTKVTMPNTVTKIEGGAFEGCSILEEIKIPNSIQQIATTAFNWTNKLTNIEIDKKKGEISGMPWGCPIGERAITWLR